MNLINRIKNKIRFIFSCYYKIAKSSTFKKYLEVNNDIDYKPLVINRTTTVQPIHFFNETAVEPLERKMQDVYYAFIKSCNIIGRSNAVIKKRYVLYDYLDNPATAYVNVTDAGIFSLFNRAIHFGRYYILNYLYVAKRVIDKGIILSGNYSDNYYHFILEYIVKFSLIKNENLNKDVPLIFDSCVQDIPQFNELISLFNDEQRAIIYIDKQRLYKINEAHYFSFINEIPPNIKNNAQSIKSDYFLFDFKSIDYLRNVFFSHYSPNNSHINYERIYISRKIKNRRNVNEDEIEPLLKKYKFQIFYPEKMSIREQLLLFSHAKYIIAPSGAALTNILFCMPNTNVLVLQGIKADIAIFSSLAAHLNINMQYITGDNKALHSNFKVPLDLIEDYLTRTVI